MPTRAAHAALAASALWVAGFALHNSVLPALPDLVFGKVASQVQQGLTVLLCLAYALRCPPAERRAWLLIGGGFGLWVAGDVYWTVALYDLEEIPIPSPADAGYLALLPCAFAGLVLLARARLHDVPRTLWLDGLVAALAAGAVAAAVVVGPVTSGVSGSVPEVATNLAYPVGDLALLALVVGAVALTGWRLDRTWALLGAGLLAFWFADSLYLVTNANGTYDSGSWFDAGWNAAVVCCTAAAWLGGRAGATAVRRGGVRQSVMPVLFALVSLALLVVAGWGEVSALASVLAAASLLAVLARLTDANRLNGRLLDATRDEALTDALTGLGNRRRLTLDLDAAAATADPARPVVLAIFDLDGFKRYNDGFGHAAGDALLQRLGAALSAAVEGRGTAYRMGGDEFCVLLAPGLARPAQAIVDATRALSERGQGFRIGCSFGQVELPREATAVEAALRTADQRMYAHKRGGRNPGRESTEVLLRAIGERLPDLEGHTRHVAALARGVAERLGLPRHEVEAVRRAAELHDVGKVAVPDAVLEKPGPLDEAEWAFMRRHTLIGERIVAAAPSLESVARLVRWSHERMDGRGYPDGLVGDEIPVGARIVAVCDAFDAMVADRPYRRALSPAEAVMELRACASSQFDPAVVEAFVEVWRAGRAGARPARATA
jgi:two-component system, cell cycle response regulator